MALGDGRELNNWYVEPTPEELIEWEAREKLFNKADEDLNDEIRRFKDDIEDEPGQDDYTDDSNYAWDKVPLMWDQAMYTWNTRLNEK